MAFPKQNYPHLICTGLSSNALLLQFFTATWLGGRRKAGMELNLEDTRQLSTNSKFGEFQLEAIETNFERTPNLEVYKVASLHYKLNFFQAPKVLRSLSKTSGKWAEKDLPISNCNSTFFLPVLIFSN